MKPPKSKTIRRIADYALRLALALVALRVARALYANAGLDIMFIVESAFITIVPFSILRKVAADLARDERPVRIRRRRVRSAA